MPGEDRVCGGCHESRKSPVLPSQQALTIASGKGDPASPGHLMNFNKPVSERTEYPWYKADAGFEGNEIQAILDAKCVSCHNAGTTEYYTITMNNALTGATTQYQIPRLDLGTTPITVMYDNKVDTYPASYVSLFYPAAMEMDMGDMQIVGTVPPKWAVPSDARGSMLIEKINMTSALDANKTAWKLGEAFSDPNVKGGTRTLHPRTRAGRSPATSAPS